MTVLRTKDGKLRLPELIALGVFESFNALLSEAVPLTVSNSRAGASVSPLTGLALAEDEVDQTTINGILMQFSRAGYTTLTDEALSDAGWGTVITGGTINRSTPSAGVTQIDVVQTAGQTNARVYETHTSVAGQEETITFDIKRVSGDCSGLQMILQKATTPWTNVAIIPIGNTITDQWQTMSVTTSGIDWSTTSNIMFDTDERTCSYQIRNCRAHAGTVRMVPAPVGSAAGTVTAPDLLSCTPTWPAAGTIVQAVAPYGWSGAGGLNAAPRFYNTGNSFLYVSLAGGGDVTLLGSGDALSSANPIGTGIQVASSDWTATTKGLRFNEEARQTNAIAAIPSTTLYIGNRLGVDRPFHGAIATLIFPWVLSDAEYAIIVAGLQARLGDFAWVA